MKKSILFGCLAFIVCALLTPVTVIAAPTFTVTMPGTQSVTMRDPYQVLTYRITNTGAEAINRVTFTFPNALYYVEWNTVPPNGWTFTASGTTNAIVLTSSAAGFNIAGGASLDFNILLKGPNWTDFVAAAGDQTDTLTSVAARGTSNNSTNAGALPTWLRRSLAITLVGYPDAVGIGQTFSLTLQIENRSTSVKNNIAVTPSPPTPTYSGGATVTNTAGPVPATLSLAATTQGTITYTYQATAQGTVYFTASASTALATSKSLDSNTIVISPLAVSLSVAPLSVVSGQNVVVSMLVQNTGASTTLSSAIDSAATTSIPATSTTGFPQSGAIIIESEQIAYTDMNATGFLNCTRGINGSTAAAHAALTPVRSTEAFGHIQPSLTTLGTAAMNLISGPTPTEIASISPTQNAEFIWVYQITGAIGQTYQFQGSATANSTVTSNIALSQQGMINNYSVTISPSSVAVGSTNVTLSFTFYNGTAGVSIASIKHWLPDATWTGYQSATVTCSDGNNNWTVTNGGQQLTAGNAASRIDNGQSCTFNLLFSTIPAITTDTSYAFYSDLYDQNNTYLATVQSVITITSYGLLLGHSPPGPFNADGNLATTVTATMTAGGVPLVGRNVVFTTTAGTLTLGNAVTDAQGKAVTYLIAPVSSTNVTAFITATSFKAIDTDIVQFLGVNAPNLQYVGGSLTPAAACAGYLPSPSFTLQVENYGTVAMNLATGSYFTFIDKGGLTYTAYLDTAAAVGVNAVVQLVFSSPTNAGGGGGVTVSNATTSGSYAPSLHLVGTVTQDRMVFDKVTVTNCIPVGAGGKMRMIKWREVIL